MIKQRETKQMPQPRFRPAEPEPAPPPAPTPGKQPKTKRATSFVFLPAAVLKAPPLRHRGAGPENGLSTFELALAAACLVRAHRERIAARHKDALVAGASAMNRARPKTYASGKKVRAAGIAGYRNRVRSLEGSPAPKIVVVETTKRALLRAAGVSMNGKAHGALPAVLARLTRPIAGRQKPILKSWQTLPDGRLRLSVLGVWLPPLRHYGRVPLPLPARGANATALYLFLFGIDTTGSGGGKIRLEALYRRLGFPTARPTHALRALEGALETVNNHLARLDRAALKFDLPAAFKLEATPGDEWVKFVARWRPEPDANAAEIPTEAVGLRRKPEAEVAPTETKKYETPLKFAPAPRDPKLDEMMRRLKATSCREIDDHTRKEKKLRAIFEDSEVPAQFYNDKNY
jgi:hypothetical protein